MSEFQDAKAEGAKVSEKVKHGDLNGAIEEAQAYLKELKEKDPTHYKEQAKAFTDELVRDGGLPLLEFEFGSPDHLGLKKLDKATLTSIEQASTDPLAAALAEVLLQKWDVINSGGQEDIHLAIDQYCENRARIEMHDGSSIMYDSSLPPRVSAILYADGSSADFTYGSNNEVSISTDSASLKAVLDRGTNAQVDSYGNVWLENSEGCVIYQTDGSTVTKDANGVVTRIDIPEHTPIVFNDDILARHYADEIEKAFQLTGEERAAALKIVNDEMATFIRTQNDGNLTQSIIFSKVTAQLELDGKLGAEIFDTFASNDQLQATINGSQYQGWYHEDTLSAYSSGALEDSGDPLDALHRLLASGFAQNFKAIDVAANGGNTDNMAGDADMQAWKDKSAGRAASEVLLDDIENRRGIALFENLYQGREISKADIQATLDDYATQLTQRDRDALTFLLQNFDQIASRNGGQLTEFSLRKYAEDCGSSAETAAYYGDHVNVSAELIKGWNNQETNLPEQSTQQAVAIREWMGIDTIASLGSVDSEKIIGTLDAMTAAERTNIEKAYELTYHSSLRHDLEWRLGDKYSRIENILNRPDGKADTAGHINNALEQLQQEFQVWRQSGYNVDEIPQTDAQKAALKDIRDTLSVLNSIQLAQLRADYLNRYGISLDDALLQSTDIPKTTRDTISLYLSAGGTDKQLADPLFVDKLATISLEAKDVRMFEEAFRGSTEAQRQAFIKAHGTDVVKAAFPDGFDQAIALDYLNFGRAQLATVAAQDTHWLHTNKEAIVVALENATEEDRKKFARGREVARQDPNTLNAEDLAAYNFYQTLHKALTNAAYNWEVAGWESTLLHEGSTFIKDFTATHHDGALGSAVGSWTDSYAIQNVFRNMSEADWEILSYKGANGLSEPDKMKYWRGENLLLDAEDGRVLTAAEQQLADFAAGINKKTEAQKAFAADINDALANTWMNADDLARVKAILAFKISANSWEDANKCPDILDLFNLYKDKGVFGAYYRDHEKLINGVLNLNETEQQNYWNGKRLQDSGRTDFSQEEQALITFAQTLDQNVDSYLDDGAMKDAAHLYLADIAKSENGSAEPSALVLFLHNACTDASALTLTNAIANDKTGQIKAWIDQNHDLASSILTSALYKCDIPSGITYDANGFVIYPTRDPIDVLCDSILSGTTTLQDKLLLTNDKTEILNLLEHSTQDERNRIANNEITLSNLSTEDQEFLRQIARDVVVDENNQAHIPPADTVRAYVLGYANEVEVRALLSQGTPDTIAKMKAEYGAKFGGADLGADLLNKIDPAQQSQYIAWLHSTEIVATQDFMDKTHDLNNSYSLMDGFMRSGWDGTKDYAYQSADAYAAALKEYSSKFEQIPEEVREQLSQRLESAIKAFKDSRGAMNEQLVDLAIMLGTMAVTMGGSALLQATALSTRMAVFAASGAIFKVLAKRAMDGTEAEMDLESILHDAVTGGLSGGFAAITPEDLLAALPQSLITKLAGGVTSADIIGGLGERVTQLIGDQGQAALQEKIDHMILQAIATGRNIDAKGALGIMQNLIDNTPELAAIVAQNPGLKDTIANSIANSLATEIQIGSTNALLNLGQQQLRGLIGGETIMEISTTVSVTAGGVMNWDDSKSIGENMSIIVAQVLEADKQALGTGLVFHFGMQGFGMAVQVGTEGAKFLGLVKPGEPPTPANLVVTYEDGSQQIIKPGQSIPDISKVKDVAAVPEILARTSVNDPLGEIKPNNGGTENPTTVLTNAIVDTNLKSNVETGIAELSLPAQRLIADDSVILKPVKDINDIAPELLDQLVPGKDKTFRQMLEDPTESGAFYDPSTNTIYLRPDANSDAINHELWHAVNKGLKDFAGSESMLRAIGRDQTLGLPTDRYFDPALNEQANQEIFQQSARILEKLQSRQALTAGEMTFLLAHPNAVEVTAERLFMQGILQRAPWELLIDSPATKENPHPGIDGSFKSAEGKWQLPPDAVGDPLSLVPVAADAPNRQIPVTQTVVDGLTKFFITNDAGDEVEIAFDQENFHWKTVEDNQPLDSRLHLRMPDGTLQPANFFVDDLGWLSQSIQFIIEKNMGIVEKRSNGDYEWHYNNKMWVSSDDGMTWSFTDMSGEPGSRRPNGSPISQTMVLDANGNQFIWDENGISAAQGWLLGTEPPGYDAAFPERAFNSKTSWIEPNGDVWQWVPEKHAFENGDRTRFVDFSNNAKIYDFDPSKNLFVAADGATYENRPNGQFWTYPDDTRVWRDSYGQLFKIDAAKNFREYVQGEWITLDKSLESNLFDVLNLHNPGTESLQYLAERAYSQSYRNNLFQLPESMPEHIRTQILETHGEPWQLIAAQQAWKSVERLSDFAQLSEAAKATRFDDLFNEYLGWGQRKVLNQLATPEQFINLVDQRPQVDWAKPIPGWLRREYADLAGWQIEAANRAYAETYQKGQRFDQEGFQQRLERYIAMGENDFILNFAPELIVSRVPVSQDVTLLLANVIRNQTGMDNSEIFGSGDTGKKASALARRISPFDFEAAYKALGGADLGPMTPEQIFLEAQSPRGRGAAGLSALFGDQFQGWIDAQRTYHRTTEEAVGWILNATSWLDSATPKDRQDLVSKLSKNPGAPIEELEMLARNWMQLSEAQRQQPFDDVIKTIRARTYPGAEDLNFAAEAAKWGVLPEDYAKFEERYLAAQETESPFPTDRVWESGNLKGHFIPRSDPRAIFLGPYTNCCQHPYDVGASCAWYGLESANSGFFVVEDAKGQIVAQSWAWESDDGGLVFDNIESKGLNDRSPAVASIYQKAANDLSNQYWEVTVGHSSGDMKEPPPEWVDAGVNKLKPPSEYSGYTDSAEQWVLASNPELRIEQQERSKAIFRGLTTADRPAIERIAQERFPVGWTGISFTRDSVGQVMEAPDGTILGYAIWEPANHYISEIAVSSDAKPNDTVGLIIKLSREIMKDPTATWSADCRESTSYALIKRMEQSGRIRITSDQVTNSMNGEPMHHVEFVPVVRGGE
ncbi:MAG: hypothetical protein JST89_24220 [Cyanobacteria bacterium SZAS-4]|nr:hypothetical protein [Cyanobacteria bacterium SZAS-4]